MSDIFSGDGRDEYSFTSTDFNGFLAAEREKK
jgi:hypothetical protein